MGVTRIRYLLDQWRIRSIALTRIDTGLSKDKGNPPWKAADPAPPREASPPENGPAAPE